MLKKQSSFSVLWDHNCNSNNNDNNNNNNNNNTNHYRNTNNNNNNTDHYRSTGIHTKRLGMQLKKNLKTYNVETLQKSVLLGTANILRKVLSIKQ